MFLAFVYFIWIALVYHWHGVGSGALFAWKKFLVRLRSFYWGLGVEGERVPGRIYLEREDETAVKVAKDPLTTKGKYGRFQIVMLCRYLLISLFLLLCL